MRKTIKITNTGYRRNSPDVNNKQNLIPASNISMKNVDFPVLGKDNLGNSKIMFPEEEHQFPGNYVLETPMMQNGGLTFLTAPDLIENRDYKQRVNKVKEMIFNAETKNEKEPYKAINNDSGALGKYQFIPLYNPSIVENYPNLQHFINSPEAQEKYMDSKIPEYWASAYKLKEKYPKQTEHLTPDELAGMVHFQGENGLAKKLKNNTLTKATKINPSVTDYQNRMKGVYNKQNGGDVTPFNKKNVVDNRDMDVFKKQQDLLKAGYILPEQVNGDPALKYDQAWESYFRDTMINHTRKTLTPNIPKLKTGGWLDNHSC